MSNKYQSDILIIGGGLAGLAAAIELLDHHKKVIILERDKQEKFGGLAKESFPAHHPLHTGMGFSRAAVPAAENAFKNCDCLLAVSTRFSEIPTGSFGCQVPENLIHADINPEVFNKNFPAKVQIKGDAKNVLPAILDKLKQENFTANRKNSTR